MSKVLEAVMRAAREADERMLADLGEDLVEAAEKWAISGRPEDLDRVKEVALTRLRAKESAPA